MKSILQKSFFSAAGVFVYVTAVSLFLNKAEHIFGTDTQDTFLAPMFMLLLLVLSASVTGYLVLAQPIMVYLGGDKKGAVRLLFSILGWLVVFIFTIALVLFFIK